MYIGGSLLRELNDVVIESFPSVRDLETFLAFRLNVRLDRYTSGAAPLRQIVFDLTLSAEREGWMEKLILALYAERPHRKDLRDIVNRLNLAVVSELGDVTTALDAAAEALDRPATFMDRESWRARRAAFELTICRLRVGRSDSEPVAVGLLIAPDLVLSCNVRAEIGWARFNDRLDAEGRPAGDAVDVRLAKMPNVALGRFRNHSYCILRLVRSVGHDPTTYTTAAGQRGWLYLDPDRMPIAGDATYLLRHSPGGSLAFVFRDDSVIYSDAHTLRHRHDTNSLPGSPIVTKDWAVVGLHEGPHAYDRGDALPVNGLLNVLRSQGNLDLIGTPFSAPS